MSAPDEFSTIQQFALDQLDLHKTWQQYTDVCARASKSRMALEDLIRRKTPDFPKSIRFNNDNNEYRVILDESNYPVLQRIETLSTGIVKVR